ncbi:MAG: hypothetical protein ACI8RZ_004058 [Myxococcota bacterium]|jgi:hypothetical protein
MNASFSGTIASTTEGIEVPLTEGQIGSLTTSTSVTTTFKK